MTCLYVCSAREGSFDGRNRRGGLWAGAATILPLELGTRNGFADGSGSMSGLPTRISQPQRMNGFLLALLTGSVCSGARPQLCRPDAESSQRCEKTMLRHNRTAWFTHSPLIFRWTECATEKVRGCLSGIASFRKPHQQCFRREPCLPYFPCHHSVTRFGAYPAPCGAASFCFGCAAPSGSRLLPEQVCQRAAENAAQTSSGPHQESTPGPWEQGTSRRFAQECPE